MAMDAKIGDAHMPKEEVSQDQESSENAKEEDIKANETLKEEIEINTDEKTLQDVVENVTETIERKSDVNVNEDQTKTEEKESEDANFGVAAEDVKVCEALTMENEIKIEEKESKDDNLGVAAEDVKVYEALKMENEIKIEKEVKDVGENEAGTNERASCDNFNENPTEIEEKEPKNEHVAMIENEVKKEKDAVIEKDEKKGEIFSSDEVDDGDDSSKNGAFLDLKDHEKKVCEASKMENEIKIEGKEVKDAGETEAETYEKASCDNSSKNRTKIEEKEPQDKNVSTVENDVNKEKDVDIVKDDKKGEILSSDDVDGGDDSSKSGALLDLKDDEKKVCEALKMENKIKIEEEVKDAGKNEAETNERTSSDNFNEHRTKIEEKQSQNENVATMEYEAKKEKDADIENDEEKCEILSSDDVDGVDDSSKSGAFLDLKENEKKALADLRSKLEEAISTNELFKEKNGDQSKTNNEKQEEKKEEPKMEIQGKSNMEDEKFQEIVFDKDVSLWGVPLLPSKGDERTDIVLEKFLKARDFKVNDTFELLRSTILWRKKNNIDSILEEDFGGEFDSVAYMSGFDLQGHPVCYNVYGVFGDNERYNKTFGTEESRQRFLRWRLQMMEREIQKLDFRPGGISKLLQINDLKNTPGPARKDLRIAMKQAVGTLQDNYPEFVARNIFINVPFWYYAFNALLSPFLTHRTKSKFLFIRPARVTETLLKHVSAVQIPVHYGGLYRDNDPDFSVQDVSSEVIVKGGSSEVIEVPAPEEGSYLIWDLTVIGWEVNYKEEFIPNDEASYTVIIKKARRMDSQEASVRNSFKNNEPGKVVLTIENVSFKKKRVLYRFKTMKGSTSSS